jgi:trk system potassium uptake protein TrkA
MGGPPMAVWLCEQLKAKHFAIRLFERDRARAEELAEKLDWVTVINADPTNRSVFEEENLGQADVFIALLEDDEDNIIGSVLAKTRGVETVVAVVQESKYLDIIYDIGIDQAFSTRHVAAQEIENLLDERAMRHLGSLAEGKVDVYRVRIDEKTPAVNKALRDLALSPDWVAAAIQRGVRTFVPGADDVIDADDVVLVVGKHGKEATLRTVLTGK